MSRTSFALFLLTATPAPPRLYHLLGVSHPSVAGVDMVIYLDDFRLAYLK